MGLRRVRLGSQPAAGLRHDLDFERSLIAVTASSNRSKSDRDPAEWMPPRTDAHCAYASDWVAVKIRWDLSADATEAAKLRSVLAGCDGGGTTPPPAPPASTTTTTVVAPPPPTGRAQP